MRATRRNADALPPVIDGHRPVHETSRLDRRAAPGCRLCAIEARRRPALACRHRRARGSRPGRHPGQWNSGRAGRSIRVELTGRYASGEVWGHGPFTLIAGDGSYPGAQYPLRVGSVIRMQYVVYPNDTSSRLVPFQGGDWKNEAYQVRRDRGQILVEHKVLSVCRPMKLFVLQTGFGPIETDLGCWKIP